MDIILIPGLWLDGSSWDLVVPVLEAAGHRANPLTLPGLDSATTDRTGIGLDDHVDAVVAAIDAVEGTGGVLVVGHSAGSALAHAAADARPDRVAGVVYIGGMPMADGSPLAGDFADTTVGGDLPLPEWSFFEDADLGDLDEAALAQFRDRAVPSPARLATDTIRLTDDRRYDVPATMVCPEYTSVDAKNWLAAGHIPELARIRDVTYADLPTGHWPQFTKPAELGAILVAAAERASRP